MSGTQNAPSSRFGRIISNIEETFIALLLGLMTLVTFANVLLRYGNGTWLMNSIESLFGVDFPGSLLWGLEVTLILFAWLVLFGISYGFKITAHLGVDAVINAVGTPVRRTMVVLSALACVAYGGLMMKGAWDYWAPFGGYQQTTGRMLPTGFDETTRDQGWYETEQIPIPFLQGWLETTFNMGEPYEKLPRFVPYLILPLGVLLMVIRVIEAGLRILRTGEGSLIVSHEAEDDVEDAAERLAAELKER